MTNIKPIAIYLPQFHPIPENDMAWGEGFTEWTNVRKAKPLFEAHEQPLVPHSDIGYYDLRDPNVLVKQAEIAGEHGIYGFAYYHYWFNGKRLLNTPIDNMLELGKPDYPFMLIWANENWTKRWDGNDKEVIIEQLYTMEDSINHINFLISIFKDTRYIKIDNKPVFAIYRTELIPDIFDVTELWRNECKKHGFDDLYLIRVESFDTKTNPSDIGFDAGMEFAPDWSSIEKSSKIKVQSKDELRIFDYEFTVANMLSKSKKDYKFFRTVFPAWDNTARRGSSALLFINSSLEIFEYFIHRTINFTQENFLPEEQIFFINAWNEWAEGCVIEPEKKDAYRKLEAIKRQVTNKSEIDNKHYIEVLESKNNSNLENINKLKEDGIQFNKLLKQNFLIKLLFLIKNYINKT